MKGLNDIHFHDSVVTRVIEEVACDELRFFVRYPVDWQAGRLEPRAIVFLDVLEYEVHEGAYEGPPTLLDATAVELVGCRWRVVIETTAGKRSLLAAGVELRGGETM